MGGIKLTGFVAWLLWSIAHIHFLIRFRNRLVVTVDWLWTYLTFNHSALGHYGGVLVCPSGPQGNEDLALA
jgi:NADH dehydrogenase